MELKLKVGGLEKVYYKLFSKPAETFAKTNAKLQVLMQIPRFWNRGCMFRRGYISSVIFNERKRKLFK